jgi:hypothetical protein
MKDGTTTRPSTNIQHFIFLANIRGASIFNICLAPLGGSKIRLEPRVLVPTDDNTGPIYVEEQDVRGHGGVL